MSVSDCAILDECVKIDLNVNNLNISLIIGGGLHDTYFFNFT